MNRWLKLAISAFATLALAVTGVAGVGLPTTQAFANEQAPTMVVAAKNSSVTVGADGSGRLYCLLILVQPGQHPGQPFPTTGLPPLSGMVHGLWPPHTSKVRPARMVATGPASYYP